MFKFGRSFFARVPFGPALIALSVGVGLCFLGGCSALTVTHAPPTSQKVCEAYAEGFDRCGGEFDEAACEAELACQLGLYRSEVIVLIQTCADRVKHAEDEAVCPPLSGYLCDESQDKARLADLLPTPALEDFTSVFSTKRAECDQVEASLDSTLFDAGILMADKVWIEARSCLNRAVPTANRDEARKACSDISGCLVTARWLVSPFCP